MAPFLVTLGALGLVYLVTRTFIIVHQREAVVKQRLGKFDRVLEPGFHFMIPILDAAAYRHDMREQVIDVPPQMCITKDNIQVEVDGILYMQVLRPDDASYRVADYRTQATQLAQSTMRAEIGRLTLEETFTEREKMNDHIVTEIDKASQSWGVKVKRYEIKTIAPSNRVIETMEKQMEAERQKRASITTSTGQKEAKINVSEGERTEAINISEGEKQKRINEADGRAAEIRLLAEANAQGIQLIAEAIRAPGGHAAVKTQLVDQYLGELGKILEGAEVSVVPANIAQMQTFFESLAQVTGGATNRAPAPPMPPPQQQRRR